MQQPTTIIVNQQQSTLINNNQQQSAIINTNQQQSTLSETGQSLIAAYIAGENREDKPATRSRILRLGTWVHS
jgi:hypothetical protein